MKVKVEMPGDYARHIITEPSKGDILSRPMFDIEPYSDDGVLINDLVTKLPYGPDFYNYIMKILPREAARRNEGLIFKGEVGEKRSNRKIDLPDTYFGHPVYDYYGSDNGDPDRFVWLGEGSARKPKNVPGFYTSIYHGWQDPEYRKYAESADKKSQLLSNILNISHDFSPLLGPITPYKDPDYPWVEYPEGDVKVKNEDYNRKLRSMINSLEHELKYPSKKGGRNKEDILAEIASLKENIDKGFAPAPGHERIPVKMRDVKTGEERKFFISIPHILNMPLYNWNSRLFDFNADNLERIWKMFESADTKNDWGMWDKANQIANYAGEIDESYNTNSPYNYVIENGKLADKGYFSDYLAPRNRAPINTTGKETVKSVEVNPETGKKVVKVNVKQTPVYHNFGTDTAYFTNMQYDKEKPTVVVKSLTNQKGEKIAKEVVNSLNLNNADKGIKGKDIAHQELRKVKGELTKEKFRQDKENYKENVMSDLSPEEKRRALAYYVQNRINNDVNATLTKGKTGERAQTRDDINQEIKEKLNFQKKLASKLGMDKSKLLTGKANIFVQEGIEPTDKNVDTIKSIARDMWQTFEDEGIEDENKKWGLVGRELKRRQGIIDRNFAKEDTGNDTIGNILKGVGEFGQI